MATALRRTSTQPGVNTSAGIESEDPAVILRAAADLVLATGRVTGEGNRIGILAMPAPRDGLRGVGDRVLNRASTVLLRAHRGRGCTKPTPLGVTEVGDGRGVHSAVVGLRCLTGQVPVQDRCELTREPKRICLHWS